MKLILEGSSKKVNQIKKELIVRCKRDNIHVSVIEEKEQIESVIEKIDSKIQAKNNKK